MRSLKAAAVTVLRAPRSHGNDMTQAPLSSPAGKLRAGVVRCCLFAWVGLGVAGAVLAQSAPAPSAERQTALVRMVRQDCGSCHGMRLTGGLGPAITPQALEGKPLLSMASTIYGGRPGTPMPGWSAMLTLEEAHWVAQQLAEGFPEESRRPAR